MDYTIYPVAYFEDTFQILLTKEKSLISTKNNDIINFINNTLNININSKNILTDIVIDNKIKSIIIIPLINATDAHKIQKSNKYLWFDIELAKALLPKNQTKNLNIIKRKLSEQFKLYGLYGINNLIPNSFTSKSITAQINNMFAIGMKNNNIKRDYQNQIKIIGKDKHNPGRPLWIFQLKERNDT